MTTPNINWQRAAVTTVRVTALGVSHLLLAGGHLLQTSGSVVSKLGAFTRDKAKKHVS